MIRFYVKNKRGDVLGTVDGSDTVDEANLLVADLAANGVTAYVDAHEPEEITATPPATTLLDRAVEARRRRERMRSIGLRVR
jgi:hypothetical protein